MTLADGAVRLSDWVFWRDDAHRLAGPSSGWRSHRASRAPRPLAATKLDHFPEFTGVLVREQQSTSCWCIRV